MTLFIQNIWKLLWEMATHSRTLAWKIPWTEEPGGLQFMKSQSGGQGMWRRDVMTWHSWVGKWDSFVWWAPEQEPGPAYCEVWVPGLWTKPPRPGLSPWVAPTGQGSASPVSVAQDGSRRARGRSDGESTTKRKGKGSSELGGQSLARLSFSRT